MKMRTRRTKINFEEFIDGDLQEKAIYGVKEFLLTGRIRLVVAINAKKEPA